MAAAVVGVGLLCLPIESVQGQSVSTVTQVDLDSFSFISAGELRMSLSVSGSFSRIPLFFWSGIYGVFEDWSWVSVTGSSEDIRKNRLALGTAQLQPYYYPGNRGDYYVCRFGYFDEGFSIDEDSGWVEVWVCTGSANSSPSAYVYDSDGNFYYVDLAIDGYVISGPSVD